MFQFFIIGQKYIYTNNIYILIIKIINNCYFGKIKKKKNKYLKINKNHCPPSTKDG